MSKVCTRSMFALGACAVMLISTAGFGQEASETVPPPIESPAVVSEEEAPIVRIVTLEHADPGDVGKVLSAYTVRITTSDSPKAVILTGPEKSVGEAASVISQLDVPKPRERNVEVIVYFVVASVASSERYTPLPDSLAPIRDKIGTEFGLPNLRLMETVLMRARDGGEVQASGFIPSAVEGIEAESPSTWKASVDRVRISGQPGASTISLDDFVVGADIPVSIPQPAGAAPAAPQPRMVRGERREMGFRCDVDIVESDLAIVGKASMGRTADAVFVVATARVVPEP